MEDFEDLDLIIHKKFVIMYANHPKYRGLDVYYSDAFYNKINQTNNLNYKLEVTHSLDNAKLFDSIEDANFYLGSYLVFDKAHLPGNIIPVKVKIAIVKEEY